MTSRRRLIAGAPAAALAVLAGCQLGGSADVDVQFDSVAELLMDNVDQSARREPVTVSWSVDRRRESLCAI